MKWFKHDSNANNDAKLKRVKLKYGMEGYGLYWYCLELIAQGVEKHNLTFELEHDAEIISADTGIHQERVEEMMADFVKWLLFENTEGIITCLKMADRTDEYTQKLIKGLGNVVTNSRQSPDKVRSNRIEQNRIEQNKNTVVVAEATTTPAKPQIPYKKILETFHEKLPALPRTEKLTEKRRRYIKRLWVEDSLPDLENWINFFGYISQSDFLMGRSNPIGDRKPFRATLEWITKPENYVKILEGNYHG